MNFMGKNVRRKDMPRLIIRAAALVVALMFLIAVGSTVYGICEVRGEIRECNDAIAQKKSELKKLEQKKEYYESDEFLEDTVRGGGYVDNDETVFVITD